MIIVRRALFRCLVVLALSGLLAAGCGSPERRVHWSGSTRAGQMSYQYETFTGVERGHPRVGLGQTLFLSYNATVNKGLLTIQVLNPEQELLWEVALPQSNSGQTELLSLLAGVYSIVVRGESTGGGFDVSWRIQ